MARRIVRLALVPALLLASGTATSASALYCGFRLQPFCDRVCNLHPAVTEQCDSIEVPPGAQPR